MRTIMTILILSMSTQASAGNREDFRMSCEGNAMIMLLYFRPGIEQVQMRKDVSAACKKGELEIKDNGFSKAGPVVLGCIEGIYYGLNWMPSPMFEVLRDKYLKEKCTK